MNTLRRRMLFVLCSRVLAQAVKRAVSRCLGKSSCPFPASCLPFPLPLHSIFVLHFRLSAVREGGCFRQVEEHPDERSCGLQRENTGFFFTRKGKLYLGLLLLGTNVSSCISFPLKFLFTINTSRLEMLQAVLSLLIPLLP